jgi:hypothetical protein
MAATTRGPENDRVAEAIKEAMRAKGMNGADLARRLAEVRGPLPYNADVWVSKRLTGKITLIEPERVVYRANDELEAIAKALGVKTSTLVAAANRKPKLPTADEVHDLTAAEAVALAESMNSPEAVEADSTN